MHDGWYGAVHILTGAGKNGMAGLENMSPHFTYLFRVSWHISLNTPASYPASYTTRVVTALVLYYFSMLFLVDHFSPSLWLPCHCSVLHPQYIVN